MEVFGSWGVICREGEEEFGELRKSDKCGWAGGRKDEG